MAREERLPLAIVLLAWVALFAPPILSRSTLPARDVAATQLPWRTVWRGQVLAGCLPLWDPFSNGGRPLLANPNTMAGYPGTLLFLLAPPEVAAVWHLALHHLLLVLGCYRLARRTGAGAGAAGVGAAAAAFSGVAWSSLTFLNFQASLAWAAWAMTTVAPAPNSAQGALRRGLAGGALLGLAFLAGEPVTAGLAALAWLFVVVASWPSRLAPGLAAAFAALGVAAPVLIPLLAIYPETVRGSLGLFPGVLAADALAPRRYLDLVFPNLLGPPLADLRGQFWASASFPWQRYYPLIFPGSLSLLVLPLAARERRLRPWWLVAAAGLLGAVLLGIPPVAGAIERLQIIGAPRYSIKLLVLPTLVLSPLVAAGWQRLAATRQGTSRRRMRGVCLTMALLVPLLVETRSVLVPLLASAYPASASALRATPTATLRRAALRDWLALALPPAALALVGPAPAAITAAVLASNTLGGAGVFLPDRMSVWATPPAAVSALPCRPTAAVFVREGSPGEERPWVGLADAWAARAALVPQFGTRWGVAYVLARGPDGLEPARQELLAAAAAQLPLEEGARLARALGANAVIADRPVPGWQTIPVDGVFVSVAHGPGPRAYLARRLIPVAGFPAAVRALASAGFVPGEDALVDGFDGTAVLPGGDTEELSPVPHHRRFEVNSAGAGFLVVQQSFLSCWRARIDGHPALVEPANGANLGIRLPAGRHRIDLFLDPAPYRLGALGPCLVLLVAALTRRVGASRDRGAPTGGAARNTPASQPAPLR